MTGVAKGRGSNGLAILERSRACQAKLLVLA